MDLLPKEIRALGCLIEKQRTTPDAYPLTLNSLRLACNQSTNRDPVVAYDEADVRDALRRLERRGFVRFASGAGSRAAKYRHLLSERLPMDDGEQALLCVLMLRGAQTPGELKQRADRMHSFAGLGAVEETLERLISRGLAVRLPRRPGQKEERYDQLLGADAGTGEQPGAVEAAVEETGCAEEEPESEGLPGGSDALCTDAPAPERPPETGEHALAAEVRSLRERVMRLEGGLEEIRAELGIEAR
jgi:hypothetical protein